MVTRHSRGDGKRQIVAILHQGHVGSLENAVKAAIVQEQRECLGGCHDTKI